MEITSAPQCLSSLTARKAQFTLTRVTEEAQWDILYFYQRNPGASYVGSFFGLFMRHAPATRPHVRPHNWSRNTTTIIKTPTSNMDHKFFLTT